MCALVSDVGMIVIQLQYEFVSPCVGGSKARKLLQKINFLTSCSNSLYKCKTSDGIPR